MRWSQIPPDAPPSVQRWMKDTVASIEQELKSRVPNTEGRSELLLVSPSRKVYSVQVDDSGVLSTTLMNE